MKKILLIAGIITLLLIAGAGYVFKKNIASYFLRLNYIQFDGQVVSWKPETGQLKVLA